MVFFLNFEVMKAHFPASRRIGMGVAGRRFLLLAVVLLAGLGIFAIRGDRPSPPDYPTQVALGKKLFFDPILSLDSTISCASCHNPRFAFADSVAFSHGVGGSLGERNTPSVMNMASRPYFFYDGRAGTLEAQAVSPVENPVEMHLPFAEAVVRVAKQSAYKRLFWEAYGAAPDSVLIGKALATFQRTLESDGSAPHDRWLNDEDPAAMSPSQIRGRDIFLEKGKCFDCHFGPDFTGDEFRNVGLYDGQENADQGRFKETGDSADLGKLKVPGLRNVALTAPYMHDGRFQTLEEVVDFYDNSRDFVPNPINIDPLMEEPLHLTVQEKRDLVAFLHALTDARIPWQEE